jgi:hypothetical protein
VVKEEERRGKCAVGYIVFVTRVELDGLWRMNRASGS